MRDRGTTVRTLLVATALGAAAFVISRRLARRSGGDSGVPAEVRGAVDDGIAAGGNGRRASAEPEWIPVAAAAEEVAEGSPETTPDAGVAAPV